MNGQNKSNKGLIIGLSVGGGVLLLAIIGVVLFFVVFKANLKKSKWDWDNLDYCLRIFNWLW